MSTALVPFLLVLLIGGHATADYGLQSAYMAENKVRRADNPDWFVTLGAHCAMHGLMVCLAVLGAGLLGGGDPVRTASLAAGLAVAEGTVHFAIDDAKGRGRFSYRIDQLLHYGCKLLWTAVALRATL